jgi:hypothetical protein
LDRFGGVLGVDHPEQMLRSCWPLLCWLLAGITHNSCNGSNFMFAACRISSSTTRPPVPLSAEEAKQEKQVEEKLSFQEAF